MSNVLANNQIDERNAEAQPEEFTFTLDREQAEALFTLTGILSVESDNDIGGLFDDLHRFCNGESRYDINEPDDTLKLTELPR